MHESRSLFSICVIWLVSSPNLSTGSGSSSLWLVPEWDLVHPCGLSAEPILSFVCHTHLLQGNASVPILSGLWAPRLTHRTRCLPLCKNLLLLFPALPAHLVAMHAKISSDETSEQHDVAKSQHHLLKLKIIWKKSCSSAACHTLPGLQETEGGRRSTGR